jgi:hypothetical protein
MLLAGALCAVGLGGIAGPAHAGIWTEIPSNAAGEEITAIEYQSTDRFWFTTGNGKIFRRVGGTFQQEASIPGVVFRDIEFQQSGNVGLAVGTNGAIYRSTNGGDNWALVTVQVTSHPTADNDCVEALQTIGDADSVNFNGAGDRAWVTADGSQIATSSGTNLTVGEAGTWSDANDGGAACRIPHDIDDTFPVPGTTSVYFVAKYFGEVYFSANNLTSNPTLKAGDAGNGFEQTRRLAGDPGNPNRQWAVLPSGAGGSYYGRTDNGWSGADGWDIANPAAGSQGRAFDVDFAGGTVIAAGEGGMILHSIDGRNFFHDPADGLTEDWRAVSVADGANAAVGGTNGKLVITTAANVTPDIVKPTGTIAGPATAAAGAPVAFTLNAADTGGSGLNPASYVWTSAGLPNAGGNPATFTFPSPGFYSVKVTFADNAGNTETATKSITINRPPASGGGGGSTTVPVSFTGPGNSLGAKIVGNRVRVRARGTVALPAGARCSGKVKLTVKRKRTTLAKRTAKLKSKSGKCRFGKTIFIKRSKVGRTTTRLRLKVAVTGNAALSFAPVTKTLVIKK